MADEAGIPTVYLEHQLSPEHKGKKGIPLIDKLRHKMSQSRSWMSSINSVRTAVAERRSQNETIDAAPVQNCLDRMQKAIKVVSAQTLKERLDLIGRQLGLNADIQDKKISLGMDAFYIEIRLSDSGELLDVKLSNQGDIVDCPDLKEILKKGEFTEFIEHLQGLQSIYQVTKDEKLKSKAFIALQSLEKDLNQLAQFQSSISGVANYIHKCPLGVMLPRLAGKPMKLIYFVSPYDLLDKKSLTAHPLTVEAITDNFLGQSVTVCIEPVDESSPSNKLQTMPLMNVSKTADGKSLPSFSSWSPMNSTMLPASFVLVLPQSIPVSTHIIQKITTLTTQEIHKDGEVKNLQSLILESFSHSSSNSKKLLVSLPDQHHVYILNGLNGGSQVQQGVMVSRIPFTHPTHVPKILNDLRQQLLFNIIVGSCIRPDSGNETSDSIVFEVNAVSLQQLTIAFEHPAYDSLITVDIDLSDITSLKCQISCANPDQLMCSDETISRVFQRCMSIPIMLRWLVRKGRYRLAKLKEAALAKEKERLEKALLQKEMQQRQAKLQASILPTKSRPPPQPPHPPPLPPPPSYPVQQQHHSSPHLAAAKGQPTTVNNGQASHLMPPMMDESRSNSTMIPSLEGFRNMPPDPNNAHHLNNERNLLSPESDKAFTPALSTSSQEEEKGTTSSSQSDVNDNPMLSRLLDDNISVATNINPMNCKPNHPNTTTTTKRPRKRKSQADFNAPPIIPTKQRMSDSSNDSVDRLSNMGCSMDMDIGGVLDPTTFNPAMTIGMPSMSSPHGHHPSSHQTHHSMLNHSAVRAQTPGNIIDLTEEESSLKKLADSVDSLDKRFSRNKDVKAEPDLTMLLYENDNNAMSRIPNTVQNIQNSPQGSKNENASTSLEGFLKGSGEVGRANNYDPADVGNIPTSCSFSKLSSLLLAPSEGPPPIPTGNKHQLMNSTFQPDKVRNLGEGKTTINHALMQDIKPPIKSPVMNVLQKSSSLDFPAPNENKQAVSGIFEKFEPSKMQQQLQKLSNIKSEGMDNESGVPSGEGRVSLKFTLKQQNSMKSLTKQSNSIDELDLHPSKLDSTGAFDFKSDEEEDDNPIMSRYVYSSSPTRLQISTNKQKKSSEPNVEMKVEKMRKKDKSSANSTKRKREKEESRREKKRKKNEHNIVSESVYRTVENEVKSEIPKLKIRVAKKPVSDKNIKSEFSEFTAQSYEISKKLSETSREPKTLPKQQVATPAVESKVLPSKQIIDVSIAVPTPVIDLVKEKESESCSPPVVTPKTVSKSSVKSGVSAKSNTVSSKTDPKLVTKATIRLKPLTMINSGTTISVSQSTPKSAQPTTANSMKVDSKRTYSSTSLSTEKKTSGQNSSLDRRASLSGMHERRNNLSSVSSSSTTVLVNSPVTTTTANISLSSILPNLPSVNKLPRIPKLSSSSSNASIKRTSSLDPAAGTNTSPASSGSKANNSYNTAGRHNTVSPSGPGPGGGRGAFGNNSSSFNYNNNRMAPPGSWNSRPTTPSNTNRSSSGPQHRQSSPMGGSNNSMRPAAGYKQAGGPHGSANTNAPTGGGKTGGGSANKTNTPLSKMNNNNGSSNSNFNSNTNTTQKSFASGAKVNNNVNPHAKLSNVNSAGANMKTSQANFSNTANVQRYSASQTNSVRSQSTVTKSPNTAGVNQSPNACHSPVTGSNRSPSLNSAGKSPNFSSSSSKSPNLNRSPSLTSSPNINRSPNINNPNRSPNVQTVSSNRSSSSMSSSSSSRKSPLTVPNKSVPGASKHSLTVKTTPSSNSSTFSSSSQKPTSIATTKPSILKNAIRPSSEVTSVSSSQNQPSTTASVNQSYGNKVPVYSSANTTKKPQNVISVPSTISSPIQPSIQPLSTITTTTVTNVVQNSPIQSTSVDTKLVNSISTSISDGSKKSNNGNSSSSVVNSSSVIGSVSETSPTFSSGIDSKSKVTTPAVRGRKNSLSAIVDKLKHNAVGSGLDVMTPKSNATSQSLDNKEVSDKTQTQGVGGEKRKLVESSHQEPSQPSQSVTNKSIPPKNLDPSSHIANVKSESPIVTAQKSQVISKKQSSSSASKTSDKEEAVLCSKKDKIVNDSDVSLEGAKPKKSSSISPLTVPSPSSNPSSFPLHQSPLSRSRTPSPSITLPKSNGESPAQSPNRKDRIFKIPSVKELEERTSSPDLGKSSDPAKINKLSDSNQITQIASVFNQSYFNSAGKPDKKLSKSVESPLSDISSPDNDLVIDDESLNKPMAKLSSSNNKNSQLNISKNSSCSSPVPKTTYPLNQKSDKVGEIPNNRSTPTPISGPTDSKILPPLSPLVSSSLEGVASSPQTSNSSSRPASALSTKSPAYPRTHSGASTPKGSESPFEIDDDLMDVALGCDS